MRFPKLILGAGAVLALSLPAVVHTRLVRAEPAFDATVSEAPKQIRLWWSDPTESALTSATLLKEDRSPVGVVKMADTDDSLSTAGPIPVALTPGKYFVMWKTASRDGHVVRGTYSFTFAPGGKP